MNRSHEHAHLLLRKAREEARVITQWVEDESIPIWLLGFHAQQAIEKALKAVLTFHDAEYPHTHNLTVLIELIRKENIETPAAAPSFALDAFRDNFSL